MLVFPFQVKVVDSLSGENSVTLTCNTETEGKIAWKFHDGFEEVMLDDNIRLEGLNLTIMDVDEGANIGEYSCWRGQEKLSSVYLLLEAREEDASGEITAHQFIPRKTEGCIFRLLCAPLQAFLSTAGPSPTTVASAVSGTPADTQQFALDLVMTGKAYISKKHIKYPPSSVYVAVTWSNSSFCSVLFAFHCSARRRQSCQWHTSSTRLSDGGFQFELPHSLSPYVEESGKLEVTAEAIQDFSIVRKTKTFYLRDISE